MSGGGTYPLVESDTAKHLCCKNVLNRSPEVQRSGGQADIGALHKKILWSIATVKNLFSYSPIHLFTFKKAAFTLAEVLITLGIIGIVAAITMPTLINKIQDRQLTAMWKKKYSEIANVYNIVKEDIGGDFCVLGGNNSSYSTLTRCRRFGVNGPRYSSLSPEFVDNFVSHLKVIDSCGYKVYGASKDCHNYYVRWVGLCGSGTYYGSLAVNHGSEPFLKSGAACSASTGLSDKGDLRTKAVLLADGSVIYFGGAATGMITVDVNGFMKGPNVVGRDVFAVMVNEDWIKPLGADGTYNLSDNGGKRCECSRVSGAKYAQGFLGSSDLFNGEMISGACCSATKLGL